ncbi:MAG TPA: iron ABC transporter permease [Kiritimatiellia bacterium]|nr:iron ABC transporter permease [Kiritimatiellia bacterium]MBP9573058.1 iron ABC transporter permease [Kiritimatiellia bacterium]HQF21733.1 iron ABC transporter permease [Kiritimatiellia bacterium]HQG75813.1 iron ABC transporter permease [Kiritimatiellia bacterium]
MKKSTAWLIFGLTTLALSVLFFWPLGRVVSGGFWVDGHFTWRYLRGVFSNPIYVEGLFNSLKIALGTTSFAMVVALPLAWLANQFEFRGKAIFSALVLVPMILPPFVGAIGFQQIFGAYGMVNTLFGLGARDWLGGGQYAGVVLLQTLSLYPILYLNAVAALANIDPAMEEAAANLGCTRLRRFFRITLPLMMPGLFAGGTLIFIWSFTELGTPLIMNYTRCAPVQIYDSLKEVGSNPFPYALVSVMLAASVGLYAVSRWLFGGKSYAMQSKASTQSAVRRLTGARALLAALPFAVVTGLALLPHLGVILTSFAAPGTWYQTILPGTWSGANYMAALGHDMTVSSIRNSLLFSSVAVSIDIVAGIAIAFVVVRSNLRLRGVLDALAMIPLAVPGLVMAFGFMSVSSSLANWKTMADHDWWLKLVDVRTNPTLFLVLAYSVRRLPYMVRSAVAGLQQTSVTFEEAAWNLGASPAVTLRRITLPLILANLIAGALLTFAFSMLEVSDSLMLAQQADYMPITKAIFELFQLLGTGKYVAAALGVWAMAFLTATLIASSLLLGKKLGAVFRVS